MINTPGFSSSRLVFGVCVRMRDEGGEVREEEHLAFERAKCIYEETKGFGIVYYMYV